MSFTSSPRSASKTTTFLALASLLAASFPLALFLVPTADATATPFEEEWELDPRATGWNVTGILASQDPTKGHSGGSLSVNAQVPGDPLLVQRGLNITLGPAPYNISFWFRNEWTSSRTTTTVTFSFPTGGYFAFTPNRGTARNQVGLYTNEAATGSFLTYDSAKWYGITIELDPAAHTIQGRAYDANGNFLSQSLTIPIPANATKIGDVLIRQDYAGQDPINDRPRAMNFDSLKIVTASPPRAPTVTATPGPGAGETRVMWQPPADNGGSRILYYKVYAGDAENNLSLAASTTTLSYSESGLGDGLTRYYKVSGVNIVGEGDYSNTANTTTFTPPSAPLNLTARPGNATGEVFLSWEAPTDTGHMSPANLTYEIHRGFASGTETFLRSVVGVTNATDHNVPNGTRAFYRVLARTPAGAGGPSNEADALPAPDRVSAPYAVIVLPDRAWPGDERALEFLYDLTVSECAPGQVCPVRGEWRVLQDAQPNATGGTLLANGTFQHPGHAEKLSVPIATTIAPTGEPGTHSITVLVNTRQGSTEWGSNNTTIWIRSSLEGYVSSFGSVLLNRSNAPVGTEVRVTSQYTVFESQCTLNTTCPVTNEWQVRLQGEGLTPSGAVLARGTNIHPAHGTDIGFNVTASITVPEVPAGDYAFVLAARHNSTAEWQTSSTTPFRVNECSPYTDARRAFWQPRDAPTGTKQYATTYTLESANFTNLAPLTFYNPCPDGESGAALDNDYEVGRGGALLPATEYGSNLTTVSPGSHPIAFVVASDLDGDHVLRDDGSDCLKGPYWDAGPIECPPGVDGNILAILLDDPHNPYLDARVDPWTIMGTVYSVMLVACSASRKVHLPCETYRTPTSTNHPPFEPDSDYDGFGDAWTAGWARTFSPSALTAVITDPNGDKDGDGLHNLIEYQWLANPLDTDTDNDGWQDGEEADYWTDDVTTATGYTTNPAWPLIATAPLNPDALNAHYWPNPDPARSVPKDPRALTDFATVRNGDVDSDGLKDGFEFKTTQTYPEFYDSDCALNQTECDPPGPRFHKDDANPNVNPAYYHRGKPGTGDNLSDKQEYQYWNARTVNSTGSVMMGGTGTPAWKFNFDGDRITNNLLDPDSDGDDVLDGVEVLCRTPNRAADPTDPATATRCTVPYRPDTDYDGLLDGEDVVVPNTDPRYTGFAARGVMYKQESATRRFLGEASLGTDPLDPATFPFLANNDSAYAKMLNPDAFREGMDAYADYGPNQDLLSIDPTIDAWLKSDAKDRVNETIADPTSAINFTKELTAASERMVRALANQTGFGVPETVSVSDIDAWLVNTSDAALDCTQEVVNNVTAPLDQRVVGQHVECITGVVQEVTTKALDALQKTQLPDFVGKTLADVQHLLDALGIGHIEVPDPLRPINAVFNLSMDPNDLGAQPTAPPPSSPFSGTGVGPATVEWGQTVFPNLTSWTTGSLFGVVRDFQENKTRGVQLIGTLDAAAYSIYIEDAAHPQGVTILNWPIGSPRLVNLNNPSDPAPTNPDFLVKAEFMSGLGASQAPRVTIDSLRDPLHPLKANVSVFLQVPSTDLVAALGNDASVDPMPGHLVFSLGSNALQRSVGAAERSSYTFQVETTDALAATHLMGAYIKVVETEPQKAPVPGERADFIVNFTRTPSLATATINETSDQGGLRITWSGAATPSIVAAGAVEHGGSSASFSLTGLTLPASFTSSIQKDEGAFSIAHAAAGASTMGNLTATWEGTNAGSKYQGGFTSANVPPSVHVTLSTSGQTASVPDGQTIGLTNAFASNRPASAVKAPCIQGSGQYLMYNADAAGSCATLRLDGVATLSATWTNGPTFSSTRTSDAGRFDLLVNDPAASTGVFLGASEWPQTVTQLALTRIPTQANVRPTHIDVAATLSRSMTQLDYSYETRGSVDALLSLTAKGVPASFSLAADYPTGKVWTPQSASARLGDVSLTYDDHTTMLRLGDDNGAGLVGDATGLHAAALRLRNVSSVDFQTSFTDGIRLTTNALDNRPFHARYGSGSSQLSANLPKLLSSASITYTKTPEEVSFLYTSGSAIEGWGNVIVADDQSTLMLNTTDWPATYRISTQVAQGQVAVEPSSKVKDLKFILTDGDRTIDTVPWHDYVSLDKADPIVTTSGLLPRLQIKQHSAKGFWANLSATRVQVENVSDPGANVGANLSIHYADPQGWVYQNITTTFPPRINFTLNRTGGAWSAAPGKPIDIEGAARFDGFSGTWKGTGMPAYVGAKWTAGQSVYDLKLDHNATNGTLPMFDFNGTVRLLDSCPGVCPDSLVHFKGLSLPARVTATSNTATGRFTASALKADGSGAQADELEVAYVANWTMGYPTLLSNEEGTVAWLRPIPPAQDDPTAPQQFFVRFKGLSTATFNAQPDPQRNGQLWFEYNGAKPAKAHLDVRDRPDGAAGGTSLLASIEKLPSSLSVGFMPSVAAPIVDVSSSEDMTWWQMDWKNESAQAVMSGTVPARASANTPSIHAQVAGGVAAVTMPPGKSASFALSLSAPGQGVVPQGVDSDYAVLQARPAGASTAWPLALNLTSAKLVLLDPAQRIYEVNADASHTVYLDVAGGVTSLKATVTGMAPTWRATFGPMQFDAGASTALVGRAVVGAGKWDIDASGVPPFQTAYDPAQAWARMRSTSEAGFTSLTLKHTSDPESYLPALPGDGFVLDLAQGANGGTSTGASLVLKASGVKLAEFTSAEDSLGLHIARQTSGGAFDASLRLPSRGFQLHVDALPSEFTHVASRADRNGGLFGYWGGSSAIGAAKGIYTNGTADPGTPPHDMLWWDATSLPAWASLTVATLTPTNGNAEAAGVRLQYLSAAQGAGITAQALSQDGLRASLDLSDTPMEFTLKSDPANGRATFDSVSGSASGKFWTGKAGHRAVPPLSGARGGSMSIDTSNPGAYLNLNNLQSLTWYQNGTESDVHLRLSAGEAAPFALVGESNQAKSLFALATTPATVDLSSGVGVGVPQTGLRASAGPGVPGTSPQHYVGATYSASSTATSGTIQQVVKGSQQQGQKLQEGIIAQITSVPTTLNVMLTGDGAGGITTLFEAGEDTTTVDVKLVDTAQEFVRGVLKNVSHTLPIWLNPLAGPGECVFNLDTQNQSVAELKFSLGLGMTRESQWLRGGSDWIGVDLRSPTAPNLDVNLHKPGPMHFCLGDPEGYDALIHTREGWRDFRLSYQRPEDHLQVQLTELKAGVHHHRREVGGAFTYEGPEPGIDSLYVTGGFAGMKPVFGRTVLDFTLRVKTVPPHVRVNVSKELVHLVTGGAEVAYFTFDMNLAQPQPEAEAPSGPQAGMSAPSGTPESPSTSAEPSGGLDLTVWASSFAAKWARVTVSDHRTVRPPDKADWPQWLVLRNTSEAELGLYVENIKGANMTLNSGSGTFLVDELKLQPGANLHVTTHTIDHDKEDQPETRFGLGIEGAPNDAKVDVRLSGFDNILSSSITAVGSNVQRVVVFIQTPKWPIDFELDGIPADRKVTLDTLVGTATSMEFGVWNLAGGWEPTELDGIRLTLFADAYHYTSLSVGRTQPFNYWADFDGASNYTGTPLLIYPTFWGSDTYTLTIADGAWGVVVEGGSVKTLVDSTVGTASVLLSIYQTSAGMVRWVKDALSNSEVQGALWMAIRGQDGATYTSPPGYWEG